MPDPCAYDSQDDFHAACMAERHEEHPDEEPEQANAACFSMWRERDCNKDREPRRKKVPGFQCKAGPQETVVVGDREAIFVASTETPDRDHDIVRQRWVTRNFMANPVFLFQHEAQRFPIGRITRWWTEGQRSLAHVEAPPEGMDELADKAWRFIRAGFLRAVSVGFLPVDEPIPRKDASGEFLGWEFPRSELLELSLVSVPANPEALAFAKALSFSAKDCAIFFEPEGVSAGVKAAQHFVEVQRLRSIRLGVKHMPGRLQNLQTKVNETLDAIEELADKVAVQERDFDEDEQKTYDDLKQTIEELNKQIARERDIEQLAKSAVPVQAPPALASDISGGKPNTPKKLKAGVLVQMARSMYHGGGKSAFAAMGAATMLGYKEAAAIYKAVTNPAETTTAGWAAELMREAYADFIELLRPMSVYARTPARDALLGRNGKLLFPGLTTGVGGGWVGEAQPIPMVQGVFNEQEMLPYKLGVITSQSRELMERSDPSSDAIIRDSMVSDTAIVLDTKFVSADALVTGISPAGIRNGVTPIDGTPAGATSTLEELDAMVTAMISACLAVNMESELFFMLNPVDALKWSMRSTAAGNYPYRDDINAGMFFGRPLLQSNTVPADMVILLHTQSLYKLVEGQIMLDMSMDATVHTNTAPEQIVGGGGTPSIPSEGNVRSAFQEDSAYLRLLMPASWSIMRAGAVQVGVNHVL